MSAIMNPRQSIQGFEIGASIGLSILVTLITAAFVGMNGYHMSNYLVAKLTTSDTAFLVSVFWYAIGYGVAALEIPLGMSFITNYRLHGFWHLGTLSQFALAVLVAGLAAGAGIGSQLADAETRTNQLNAHSTAIGGFDNSAKAAKTTRDMQILAASRLKNDTNRQIAQLNAERNYQTALSSIAQSTSTALAKKPLKIMENDSEMQTIIFSLLSLVASFGAFYLSCFKAVYIEQLIGHIAFSLKAKSNHEWESDASDFRTKQHELSPLKNQNHGMLFKEKVPARTVEKETWTEAEEELLNARMTTEKADIKKRPGNDKSYISCPHCKSHFAIKTALLEPTEGNPKGLIRCGECGKTFDGKHNVETNQNSVTNDTESPLHYVNRSRKNRYIWEGVPAYSVLNSHLSHAMIPHPFENKWLYEEQLHTDDLSNEESLLSFLHKNPARPISVKFKRAMVHYRYLKAGYDEQAAHDLTYKITPNDLINMGLEIPEKSQIHREFAGNSSEIHLENQAVTLDKNSIGIPEEFDTNSRGISGGANSQELMPKNSHGNRQVDLSKVAMIDGKEAKLTALSETIDSLSADPESDGLLFSPTKAFKELHMSYPPVNEVFKLKQQEGKISLTKPYKITYRAA